jgi:hypothetical protein
MCNQAFFLVERKRDGSAISGWNVLPPEQPDIDRPAPDHTEACRSFASLANPDLEQAENCRVIGHGDSGTLKNSKVLRTI